MVLAILHQHEYFSLRKSFAILAILIHLSVAHAAMSNAQPSLDSMFQEAAQAANVPAPLTRAIARVESGLNPWALNIEGKGYLFPSKTQALEKAKVAQATGQSFDSGLMQINNRWLERWQIPLEEAFDPQTNIHLGSRILKREIDRHGETWNAVGAYHSPSETRQREYIAKVKAALDRTITKAPLQTEPRRAEAIPMLVVERHGQTIDRHQTPEPLFVRRLSDNQRQRSSQQTASGLILRFDKTTVDKT